MIVRRFFYASNFGAAMMLSLRRTLQRSDQ